MKNNSTNIKELIKRLQNGERLSPEEMRTVANHVAQLKFEKEQRAKRAQAVANEGEKKDYPSMNRLLRLKRTQRKTDLEIILRKIPRIVLTRKKQLLAIKGEL